jgi:hypothetical protein
MYTCIDLDGPQERSTILQFFFHLYVQFTTHGTIDNPMKQEYGLVWFGFMVLNASFNNSSVIS